MFKIIMRVTFLPVQNKYPATRFICHKFEIKRYIDNQTVQVADEIKRDIWKYLVSSVADDAWYIMCIIVVLPVQNKYIQLLVVYARVL